MRFAAAIAGARTTGLRLPPRSKPLVTPPPNTKSWQGTEDAGGHGLDAARTVEGAKGASRHIVKAVSMAPTVVAALALFVLHTWMRMQQMQIANVKQ